MDVPTQDLQLPGLQLTSEDSHNQSSKFDLNIVVVPPAEQTSDGRERRIYIEWEYNSDIFDEATVQRMLTHYKRLLEAAVNNPEEPISALQMTEKERQESVVHKNGKEGLEISFNF
jgi:non-ribosomal peptide synthetase component F